MLAFAFTSIGVNIDHRVTNTLGVYAFRISGELHHLSGALLQDDHHKPESYAQIYIYDPADQLPLRQRK